MDKIIMYLVNHNTKFRLKFYKSLILYVNKRKEANGTGFLCHYYDFFYNWYTSITYFSFKVNWKQLKEVKILEKISNNKKVLTFSCKIECFIDDDQRILFIEECITLLKQK